MKSLQKEQINKNLLLWPSICRNKHVITPKWINSYYITLGFLELLCYFYLHFKNPKKCLFLSINYSMFFLWNIFDYILTPCTKLSYCQVQHQAQNWQPKHWRCLWCSPLEKPQKSFQGSILAPSQFRLTYD